MFLIWKRPETYTERGFEVSFFGIILRDDQLLVISSKNSLLESIDNNRCLNGPLDVLVAILAQSIYRYLGHLRVVKLVARELQQQFTRSMDNEHLFQMFNLSESLVYYLNAIQGNGTVLSLLRKHVEKQGFSAEIIGMIDDLIIENDQSYKQAEIYSTVFASLIEARGNLANHSTNATLRNLTLINVVFLPLNLIASIGGMSEFSMMTSGTPWWIAYTSLILAMMLMGTMMISVLKRMARSAHRHSANHR